MKRDVFTAIADPVRREIIQLLSAQPLTVNAVADNFEVSRPAISKQLKILQECGLVDIQKNGRERICRIQPQSLVPAFLWIEQYRQLWEARLDTFEAYLDQLQTQNNRLMNDLNDRTLSLERTFNAPLQLVWEAWTQAEHIANWWGPKGMKTDVVEHNFTVGGQWKYSMVMPNGGVFIAEGIYSEIVAFQKIVTSADFKPMTEGVEMHMLFEAVGEQTKFTFKVIHPTVEYCKQQEEMGFYNGWGSTFDRLHTYLEEKAAQ